MFKFIFRKAVKIPKLEDLNSFLFIGPHPDDLEIGCGATIKKLTSLGKKVSFLIATDGRAGTILKDISEEDLVKTRQDEARASAEVLGVKDITFLPFHDGNDYDLKQMEIEILKKIIELKPDIVFLPDHRLRTEHHPDHLNVGRVGTNAFMFCGFNKITKRYGVEEGYLCNNIAYYYTDKPNTIVKCKKYFDDKMKALRLHKSQFSDDGFDTLEKYFKLSGARLGIKKCTSYAEGFRVLTQTHVHCFPEGDLYF